MKLLQPYHPLGAIASEIHGVGYSEILEPVPIEKGVSLPAVTLIRSDWVKLWDKCNLSTPMRIRLTRPGTNL